MLVVINHMQLLLVLRHWAQQHRAGDHVWQLRASSTQSV